MLPGQLVSQSFAAYPAEARRLAGRQVALLRRLPLGFVPLLLRELIAYDWKFPAAEHEFSRALQLEPNSAEIRTFHGFYLSAMSTTDWQECSTCHATGYENTARCTQCDGDGWIYARRSP